MKVLKCLVLVVLVIVSIKALNFAFAQISSPSDLGVVVGIGSFLALGCSWLFIIIRKFFGKRKGDALKKIKNNNCKSLLLIALIIAGATGCAKVEPGHVGIKVNLYGKDRGVDSYPLVSGMVFYNPLTTSVLEYPTYVQTATWTKNGGKKGLDEEITFNSKEGMVMSGDVSLSYQLNATLIPFFYVKFRSDDLDIFTHGFMRNVARDAFNEIAPRYPVEDLYGPKKEEFLKAVRSRINDEVNTFGVEIQQFGFTGAPRLPENVVNALNSKITATQEAMMVQNQLLKTQAEAQKVIAEASGKAEANRQITASLSPELLKWRELEIAAKSVEKWDGRLPQYNGGGAVPFIQLPVATK